jgi:hypothetical protein
MGVYIYSVRTKAISSTLNGEPVKVQLIKYLTRSAPPDDNDSNWSASECAYNRRQMAAAEATWERRGVSSLKGTLVSSGDNFTEGRAVVEYDSDGPCAYDTEPFGKTVGYLRKTKVGRKTVWTIEPATYTVQVGTMKSGFYIRETSPTFFVASKAVEWAKLNVQPGETAKVSECRVGNKSAIELVAEPEAEVVKDVAERLLHGPWPVHMLEGAEKAAADALVASGYAEVTRSPDECSTDWTCYALTHKGLHVIGELRDAPRGTFRLFLTVELTATEVVFRGGPHGPHSVTRLSSSLERVKAHWEGYCENAIAAKKAS